MDAKEAQILNLIKPLDFLNTSLGEYIDMAFAALDRNVYARLNRRSYPIVLRHHPECAPWTASLFSNEAATGADQVWTRWNAFDAETREQYWPHLLIYLLDKFPHRALSFLQVLTYRPCVKNLNLWIIADAFEHLARIHVNMSWKSIAQREQLKQNVVQFIPTFYHTFSEHLAPHKRICSQDLLFCVGKLASIEELQRVFTIMEESGTYIGHHVLLHYANTFAKAGNFRQALSCLGSIVKGARTEKARVKIANELRFRWSCALTLHRSMMNKESYHETTGIVATLVDFGVKLDILLYNVIIHNAMEASDHTTAFRVYNTLEENGLKPDQVTFSTLLHGCTMAADPSKFNDFADYCAETAKETRDPWLAADCLYFHFVRLHRESRQPEESVARSEKLLRTYLRFFSPRPLDPFWSSDSTSSRAGSLTLSRGILSESVFMDPPPMALYIMLQVEILKATSTNMRKNHVWALYQKFTELVQTNHDPILSKLARDPIIWNAFLLSFCRVQNFEHASQVVQDMSKHHTTPNVYTWNILMQGFFKSQQILAAERVFDIMRSRGVEPDQFTYEVMLRGYARAQHVGKIGEVMEHVVKEKQVDPKLLRDLARVHDQRRVLLELEKARIRREQWKEMEAKAREQREKLKWAPPKFAPLIAAYEEKVEDKDVLVIKSLFDPGSKPGLRFGHVLKK
ncbi:hypothetical protein SLS60_000614 [Paraconiothyrium brasiliense]|uniref:Pentatricopeptide repeat-containing protein n=1 Tax=Paraconiothyrium brasiliense TaxID=300254 RepID=A0ABR3S7J0_9PLEO